MIRIAHDHSGRAAGGGAAGNRFRQGLAVNNAVTFPPKKARNKRLAGWADSSYFGSRVPRSNGSKDKKRQGQ